MNKFKFTLLLASFMLALAFTISCSSDNGEEEEVFSSGSTEISSSSKVGDSSSSETSDSSFSAEFSSSSGISSSSGSDLCEDFVEGTTRMHYGKLKEQFCDKRDGKKYVYVEIGTQIWMAENLSYEAPNSYCNENDDSYCDTYGGTYDWATAMGFDDSCNKENCFEQIKEKHQGICPTGWHLPSKEEWQALIRTVDPNALFDGKWDINNIAGTKLKSDTELDGTENYGFSALFGGYHSYSLGIFYHVNSYGCWWTATEYTSSHSYGRNMSSIDANVAESDHYKSYGDSVRCLKDNP